jgi:hypothetical protein
MRRSRVDDTDEARYESTSVIAIFHQRKPETPANPKALIFCPMNASDLLPDPPLARPYFQP